MEGSDIQSPLMENRSSKSSAKFSWQADAAEIFILLCSFLLTTASTALVILVLVLEGDSIPSIFGTILSYLTRVISSLSLTVTSAVIMVAGKRYVFFKFARGGLRIQRVAVYSDPTIGNMVSHLVLRGVDLPLLGLSAVWGLAWAAGLTVNDSWKLGPSSSDVGIPALSGPLDFKLAISNSSWVTLATEELIPIMSSWCTVGPLGLININSANTDHPMGTIYYPPLPIYRYVITPGYSFSTTATMNGFDISLEQLPSVPPTARNMSTCMQNLYYPTATTLWYDGSDDQTLSLVIVDSNESDVANSTYRINATLVVMGGTLSSNLSYSEFVLNGTLWPNAMSTGDQWAEDIIDVVCNTTFPQFIGTCAGSGPLSFLDFTSMLDGYYPYGSQAQDLYNSDKEEYYFLYWSSVLSMALGAYSFAMLSSSNNPDMTILTTISATINGSQLTATYATYILLVNTIVSTAMFVIVVALRRASHLGPDFLNPARLLLDPLKKPELFNASLKTTVDALADPYMLVEDNAFLVVEQKVKREEEGRRRKRKWFGLGVLTPRKRPFGSLGHDSKSIELCDSDQL